MTTPALGARPLLRRDPAGARRRRNLARLRSQEGGSRPKTLGLRGRPKDSSLFRRPLGLTRGRTSGAPSTWPAGRRRLPTGCAVPPCGWPPAPCKQESPAPREPKCEVRPRRPADARGRPGARAPRRPDLSRKLDAPRVGRIARCSPSCSPLGPLAAVSSTSPPAIQTRAGVICSRSRATRICRLDAAGASVTLKGVSPPVGQGTPIAEITVISRPESSGESSGSGGRASVVGIWTASGAERERRVASATSAGIRARGRHRACAVSCDDSFMTDGVRLRSRRRLVPLLVVGLVAACERPPSPCF